MAAEALEPLFGSGGNLGIDCLEALGELIDVLCSVLEQIQHIQDIQGQNPALAGKTT